MRGAEMLRGQNMFFDRNPGIIVSVQTFVLYPSFFIYNDTANRIRMHNIANNAHPFALKFDIVVFFAHVYANIKRSGFVVGLDTIAYHVVWDNPLRVKLRTDFDARCAVLCDVLFRF